MSRLCLERLSPASFAAFGQVIQPATARQRYLINRGSTERFHDLAEIDVSSALGQPLLSLFRAQACALPMQLQHLECHPLGSQAFIPLSHRPYLVVVAPAGPLDENLIRGFLVTDGSGVNYARGCWHHQLLALEAVSDFWVIDRGGPGQNLREQKLLNPRWLDCQQP